LPESATRIPPAAIRGGKPVTAQLAPPDDWLTREHTRRTGWWPVLTPAAPRGWLVSVVGPAGPLSTHRFSSRTQAEAEVRRLWGEVYRVGRAAELADRLPQLFPPELRPAVAGGDLTAVRAAADGRLEAGDEDGYLWLASGAQWAENAGPLRLPLGDGRVAWLNVLGSHDLGQDVDGLGMAVVTPGRSVAMRWVAGWFAADRTRRPAERVVWRGSRPGTA
jgi:hypothetical protein